MAKTDGHMTHRAGFGRALARKSVSQSVAEKIAALISSGVLSIGDELPSERDMAQAWQVSRESVRGGVRILARSGILAVTHGARTRVLSDDIAVGGDPAAMPRINSYDVHDINAARCLVELEVVRSAAGNVTPDLLDLLEHSLQSQRYNAGKPVEFLINDREFHFAIYRAGQNAVLADQVIDLYDYMMPNRVRAMASPGAVERSYADHVDIFRSLKDGTADDVVRAFEHHIERIYVTTLQIVENESGKA